MAGNAREWCLDEYDENFYLTSQRRNPIADADGITYIINNFTNVKTSRVVRGGRWDLTERFVRVASRASNSPTDSFSDIGFRCARSVTR